MSYCPNCCHPMLVPLGGDPGELCGRCRNTQTDRDRIAALESRLTQIQKQLAETIVGDLQTRARLEQMETIVGILQRALGWEQYQKDIVLDRVIIDRGECADGPFTVIAKAAMTDAERAVLEKKS